MNILEIKNISYSYSKNTPFEIKALDNVNLSIKKGSLTAVIGHTGSGKSTLIKMFNALLVPDFGSVLLNGEDINKDKLTQHNVRFKVGLCFQYPEYQLFEETVYKDIAYGPKNMKLSESEIDSRIRNIASFVGITPDMLKKSPFDLSGGEKRRVAIAGVMAMQPEVLVLDEPAAGLDPRGKNTILNLIKDYRVKTGATVIIVSHSMEDAADIADDIVVMNKGSVALHGDADEVFSHAGELVEMGLNVPCVTNIMLSLKKAGYDVNTNIYTMESARKELCRFVREGGAIG
ncbi:MAG: energy-coupling factor transporter ATPase [Oscillospiraceae bacterium]|nr:energy-coupling factor transporter ATPase [Oscillospiraceae bacterium]